MWSYHVFNITIISPDWHMYSTLHPHRTVHSDTTGYWRLDHYMWHWTWNNTQIIDTLSNISTCKQSRIRNTVYTVVKKTIWLWLYWPICPECSICQFSYCLARPCRNFIQFWHGRTWPTVFGSASYVVWFDNLISNLPSLLQSASPLFQMVARLKTTKTMPVTTRYKNLFTVRKDGLGLILGHATRLNIMI